MTTEDQALDRAAICAYIAEVAKTYGVGQYADLLCRQCAAESSFDVAAHNRASGAYGLFQLMAPTAAWLKVNRYDWRDNVTGGVKYMAWLLRLFPGDYAKALAAFNWGQGNVLKEASAHGAQWRDHLPVETAGYLSKILLA